MKLRSLLDVDDGAGSDSDNDIVLCFNVHVLLGKYVVDVTKTVDSEDNPVPVTPRAVDVELPSGYGTLLVVCGVVYVYGDGTLPVLVGPLVDVALEAGYGTDDDRNSEDELVSIPMAELVTEALLG